MADFIVTILADGLVIPIILLAGYALLFKVPKQNKFDVYTRVVMAGLTAYLAAKLLALVYQPGVERPFEVLGMAPGASYLDNPGFPSDHALFTAFLTLAVWFGAKQRKFAVVLGIMTLLVCLGRVLALVHTPLDVVGGIAVASVGTVWYSMPHAVVASRKKK